jgi:16S rRNA (uracil1498-N3)-methyltransferase
VAAHVLVDDLASLELDDAAAHHLTSVLRLRAGVLVGATDGRGGFVSCVFGAGAGAGVKAGRGRLEAVGPMVVAAPRSPRLTVGFVPVKGDRPDWAVQKLTELGVDRIVLLSSSLAVVRWEGPRLRSHLERLERVARSAVMQSRQVWLPEVKGMSQVRELLGPGVAVADMSGGPIGAAVHTVLVGPEGGWSEAELEWASRDGRDRVVGLGDSVLRSETAAVAAGVLLTARRAGLAPLL